METILSALSNVFGLFHVPFSFGVSTIQFNATRTNGQMEDEGNGKS